MVPVVATIAPTPVHILVEIDGGAQKCERPVSLASISRTS
jgi:hypothetical protein